MAQNYVDLRNINYDVSEICISGDSIEDFDTSDSSQKWYWGQMTKAEVNEQLQDKPDGSFLVRDGSESGYYTLTVKKGGVNKLVKIYSKNGMYGFTEPYEFPSLEDLICYFRTHSLSSHNARLDIKLLYPVEKISRDSYGDTAKKKRDYRELIEMLRVEECKLEAFYKEQSKLQKTLQTKEQLAESLEESVSIYEEQVDRCRTFHGDVPPTHIQSVRDNFNLLLCRLQDIHDMKEDIAREIGDITRKYRKNIGEIAELKPVIRRLGKSKAKKKRWLVDMNLLPHIVEETWNVGLCDREGAIKMLQKEESGTFLVRKSEKENKEKEETGIETIVSYAISMVSEGQVVHIRIIHQEETGFGIAQGFCYHPTLMDLVLHYESTPISEHNAAIKETLKYPVRKKDIYDFYEEEPIYGL